MMLIWYEVHVCVSHLSKNFLNSEIVGFTITLLTNKQFNNLI